MPDEKMNLKNTLKQMARLVKEKEEKKTISKLKKDLIEKSKKY